MVSLLDSRVNQSFRAMHPVDLPCVSRLDMRHGLAGFGLAVFWLHVIVACVLLMLLIGGKEPTAGDWFGVAWETLAIKFPPDSLFPEATLQPSGQPGTQAPASSMTGRNASLAATGTCPTEWP